MLISSILLVASLSPVYAAPELKNAIPVKLIGPWAIEVGPGTVTVGQSTIVLKEPARFDVRPMEITKVRDEEYAPLPVFNPKTAGWICGVKARGVQAQECSSTGLLLPESLRVKPEKGECVPYALGKDYDLQPFWATFGRIEGGAIPADKPVYLDYDYCSCRIDSVVVDATGKARLVEGTADVALAKPPVAGPGETAVVNIWIAGPLGKLTDENLYPIDFGIAMDAAPAPGNAQAERFLPKTLAKLREGNPVRIVAWGDSVTNGGGVLSENYWYQNMFAKELRKRFPKSEITMITAAWGGNNSDGYMKEPPGGTHDFVRDVLDPKPDLVTIEFVNDAYFDEAGVASHYAMILDRLQGNASEVVLITPHLVRPDWLGTDTMKFDEDPRPYVKGLYQFAKANNVALADASREWCRLWRRGIPYITLEANNINHPDERGHQIFVDALMGLFPAK